MAVYDIENNKYIKVSKIKYDNSNLRYAHIVIDYYKHRFKILLQDDTEETIYEYLNETKNFNFTKIPEGFTDNMIQYSYNYLKNNIDGNFIDILEDKPLLKLVNEECATAFYNLIGSYEGNIYNVIEQFLQEHPECRIENE